MGAALGPAVLKALASWLLAEGLASGVVHPHGAVAASRAAVAQRVLVPQQAAVAEAEPVWAAWAARELAQLAEAVLALAGVEP